MKLELPTTETVGVKELAQGQYSGVNKKGANAVFSLDPPQFHPASLEIKL